MIWSRDIPTSRVSLSAGAEATPRAKTVAIGAVAALAYFLTGCLGLMIPSYESKVTLLWLPAGVATAILHRFGLGQWVAIFIGAVGVNLAHPNAPLPALGLSSANTAGPAVAALLLRTFGFQPDLVRVRDVVLLSLAGAIGMVFSAGAAVGTFLGAEVLAPDKAPLVWLTWWAGDALGVIFAAPLVFTFATEVTALLRRRLPEFLTLLVAIGAVTSLAFLNYSPLEQHSVGLAFLPLPLVAWAALRFGPGGTSAALVILSIGAVYGVSSRPGLFDGQNAYSHVLLFWLYMVTTAVLAWLICTLHRARVQARDNEALLEQALADAAFGVFLCGRDGRITYANAGFARLTGFEPAEIRDESWERLHGADTDPATAARIRTAAETFQPFEGDVLHYRKDGTSFWNALNLSPVRDDSGAVTGFLGIARDVTARRQAEQALRQSEEQFRTLVELEPGCVELIAPDGALLDMNAAGLRLFGATALDQLQGRSVFEMVAPEFRESFSEVFRRVVQGSPSSLTLAVVTLTGQRLWVEMHAVPFRDSVRDLRGVLSLLRDITETRRAAAELEESLGTLRLFIDSVPGYISFVDADLRYRFVNARYEKYFGRPTAQIVGREVADLHPPSAYAEIEPYIARALSGEEVRYEANPVSPSGERRWFDVRYVPRRSSAGVVTGFFALTFEITESKLTTLALEESRQRLEGIFNNLDEVVYSTSLEGGVPIFISASIERLYGMPVANFFANPRLWFEVIHPDDQPSVTKSTEALIATGANERQYRIRRPDGTIRTVRDRAAVVRNERGEPVRIDGVVVDVTRRIEAERAMRESESRYRQLFDANPQPMWAFDWETLRFLAVNEAALRHYGYREEEFLAMTICDIRPPEEIPALLESLRKAGEGIERTGLWRHRKRDGTVIIVDIHTHAVNLGGRRAEVVIAHDVTDRHRSELRAAGERAVLELLTAGAPLSQVLDQLAAVYEELFPGMLCSILLLDRAAGTLHHGAAPSLPAAYRAAIEGIAIGPNVGSCGSAAYLRETVLVSDIASDPHWADFRDLALEHGLRACWSVPVISSKDAVLGAFALYYRQPQAPSEEDVAAVQRGAKFAALAIERHDLVRSVQASKSQLEALMGNLPGMAYRCRGDARRTMIYVSEYCEKVTSYPVAELQDNRVVSYDDLIHPEDREWLNTRRRAALDGRVPCHAEYRIVDRHGTERWVLERSTGVYDENEGLLFIDGFIQDVTAARQAKIEREQLDRKMLETQKLESLGVLAGGIAHDFNNLLTSILGNASIAAIELPAGSPVHDCVEQITEASLRAAELCKQMLAYSGRGRFVVQKLSLGQLVEQTAQMLQISISKKAVLRFHLEAGLPLVEVDVTQIRQVIMNLVINASEAIGDRSGVISLSTGLTRVDRAYLAGTLMDPELPEGEYVYLEVSDTGCGMSAETRARIFDPFFTTKFTGRGLGLAAVLGIVRGHKGTLKVYSELGRGTTFKLLFPAASGPAEPLAESSAPPLEWHGHGTVLVVDDEETMRSTIARMMRKLGLDVVLTSDGREAVEIFRQTPSLFGAVLLDLTMPHMDGEQTFAELRRLRPNVRVVLMSGFNAQEALVRFNGKGLANFLQKPFTIDALRSVLQNVMTEPAPGAPEGATNGEISATPGEPPRGE